jgi:hypothetical protein
MNESINQSHRLSSHKVFILAQVFTLPEDHTAVREPFSVLTKVPPS